MKSEKTTRPESLIKRSLNLKYESHGVSWMFYNMSSTPYSETADGMTYEYGRYT
jgi:MFS-type transporter involved in bile tolerance (Atg22 family)